MKILIDIGHPAHVHLFKNFGWEMQKRGHEILFTCRQKEYEIELLESAGFHYKCLGKHFKTKKGKILGLFKFNFLLLLTAIKFKPDLYLSHGSIYAAHVAWLLRRPHIALEDSGNMEQIRLYLPFTRVILTPDILPVDLGTKQICYTGYHEIAYLHPDHFTADKQIVEDLGIGKECDYVLLRFVSWDATHDTGHHGISMEGKNKLFDYLNSCGLKIIISSEKKLPDSLDAYSYKFPPDKLHHVLAFAKIVISEGATIASEAGVLGIPTIYVNTIERCYNEDQQKYGLVYNFRSEKGIIQKISEILDTPNTWSVWRKRRNQLLHDKINVTQFLVWFIENYPDSENIMRKNPDSQLTFRK